VPGDHPEPESREYLHVDQRLLLRLQVAPGQHPGEVRTTDRKQRLEPRAQRLLDRCARMEAAVLVPPPGDRVIGVRGIMAGEPGGTAVVEGIPVEVVDEQPTVRTQQPGQC